MRRLIFIFLALCTAPIAAHATTAVKGEAAVMAFMAESGLKSELDKLPGQLFAALFLSVPATIPESTKRLIIDSYSAAYPNGSIADSVAKVIRVGKDAENLPKLMTIVSTPIARKMTALEQTEPTQEELLAFSKTLSMKPPSEKRLGLIRALIDESPLVDAISKIAWEASKSIELARSSGCADDLKNIHMQLENARPAMRQGIIGTAVTNMLFVYRTVTDDELQDYIATYRDPVSKAIYLTVAKTVAEEYLKRWRAFEKTLQRVGTDLSDKSMFAKSCRKAEKVETASMQRVSSRAIRSENGSRQQSALSGMDARSCLSQSENLLVAKCAAKYK